MTTRRKASPRPNPARSEHLVCNSPFLIQSVSVVLCLRLSLAFAFCLRWIASLSTSSLLLRMCMQTVMSNE